MKNIISFTANIIKKSALIRYIIVGGFNTVCGWIIFYLLYLFLHKQSISLLLSFLIMITIAFFLHAKFSFKSKVTVIKYINFVIFSGILQYLIGLGADYSSLYPFITMIISSVIAFITGFLYSKYAVFKV